MSEAPQKNGEHEGRDELGRFVPGFRGGPGRKKGDSRAKRIREAADRTAEGLRCPAQASCEYVFSDFADYLAHVAIVHGSKQHTIELCKFFPKPPADVPQDDGDERTDEETDALILLARRVDAQLRDVDKREAKLLAEKGIAGDGEEETEDRGEQ